MQERFSKSPQNLDSYDLFEWLFPLSTVSVWRGQTTMKHSDLCDIRASAGSRPKTVVWTGRQDVEETLCCLQLRWVGYTQRESCFFVPPDGCVVGWKWWKVCFCHQFGDKNNAAKWLICVGRSDGNCKAPLVWYTLMLKGPDIQVGCGSIMNFHVLICHVNSNIEWFAPVSCCSWVVCSNPNPQVYHSLIR